MNHATKTIVSTIGVALGIAGFNHGFFETLQGNTPTNGLIIQAIGPANRVWVHGTEEAFTIVPNFLVSGILAMIISLAIITWSVGFIHKQHGPTVFILLCALLFLTGGGIAQIVFFIPAWIVSAQIHKPLTWWRKVLPESVRLVLAKLWPYTLAISCVSFLIGLFIAITGTVPGSSDPDQNLSICWAFVFGGGWLGFMLTYVAGLANDIRKRIKEAA